MAVLRRLPAAVRRSWIGIGSVLMKPLALPIGWLRSRRARGLAAKVARASDPATKWPALYAMAVLSSWRTPVARALGGNPSTPRLCLRVLAHGPWDVA
ncbi:MAG TPA: hypothetical protein VN683_12700, partial [Acidothermaceae bacterium]|nr:hypothetical protein [Acidothermaceae bacterium]